jgi:hypothetical protein
LNIRRTEIEEALLNRVYAIQQPTDVPNPAYADGLRAAVLAGLDYLLAGIEADDSRPGPVPAELLAQARLAAQEGVSLDTVLRRYLLCHTLLGDFLIQEAEGVELMDHAALQQLLRLQAALVDGLIAAVANEYARAGRAAPRTTEQRRVGVVKQLLAGDLVDPVELEYDLDLCHLGLVGAGPGAEEAVRRVTGAMDCCRLLVCPEGGLVWAWIGSGRAIEVGELLGAALSVLPRGIGLAVGEPMHGLVGWRLTHRQAEMALPIAVKGPQPIVRYSVVALLASALRDEILGNSLRDAYLIPLAEGRDGGDALRQTLRAYFLAGRNASSAAAALRISRQTVNERLRKVEDRLGRSIDGCAPELETALRLREFDRMP